ncbi:DegT/DnrJ/EryC1/StrS family aminotransferase [Spirochaeta lutea]|nr:DegT/DnrJ/EryC1/StrS family aminotransferase [Spirochaeta lutea]
MQFVDLGKQYREYKKEIDQAIQGVLDSTQFINGDEVSSLEAELADFAGVSYAIGCSSGTDALLVPLMAKGVKPGDEILVPAFTYFATASMVSHWGARPVFVDVDPITFNIDPAKIEEKITNKTRGIFAVSLYGQPADFDAINSIAKAHGLWVLEDAAQSFGARSGSKCSCNLSEIATTSFFPAKPLGCYGDGGAMFTNDPDLADLLRKYINHGQSKRYHHRYVGINGRLDTIQAAILRVKLRNFSQEIELRNEAAAYYTKHLQDIVETPVIIDGNVSSWAQYTIKVENRDKVREVLSTKEIPTSVHYPMPLYKQEAFSYLKDSGPYPVSDSLSTQVLSLPMHAFITRNEQDEVIASIREAIHG